MALREIRFRGKRIDSGEWVFGMPWIFKEKSCICPWKKGMCKYDTGFFPVEVIPETVGQYTGLRDKNGKRIFEGDIVKSVYTKEPYDVCFGEHTYTDECGDEQSACGWYNTDKGGCATPFGNSDTWAIVIGNFHDNPELLEVNDEWS